MAATTLTVADLIRDAADRYGLSQSALASRLDMSRQAISARMTGRTPWTLAEVSALAQLLDLDPHVILDVARDGDEVIA